MSQFIVGRVKVVDARGGATMGVGNADSDENVSVRDYLGLAIGAVDRSLEEYKQSQKEMDEQLERHLNKSEEEAAERVKVALGAIDKRLAAMNEFRASLEDVTRDAVSRDLFDIVTNRVTVVENTYLKREDYAADTDRERERAISDFAQRDRRIADLEKNTVRSEALSTQAEEIARQRKALIYSVVGGGVLILANLIINALQIRPAG